jgi:hypothetical protein
VQLTSLHHPAGPPNAPNFTAFEGQYRYVNAIRTCVGGPAPGSACQVDANCVGGVCQALYSCPDSAVFGTSFACARLGCTPEYRNWAGIFGGAVVHVTGDSVVPSSQYEVSQLAASCAGNEASCSAASAELTIPTERWGNVDNLPASGVPSAVDISRVVDKVKEAPGAFTKPRCQVQPATPNTLAPVSALDISRTVDAAKGLAYPFAISACP